MNTFPDTGACCGLMARTGPAALRVRGRHGQIPGLERALGPASPSEPPTAQRCPRPPPRRSPSLMAVAEGLQLPKPRTRAPPHPGSALETQTRLLGPPAAVAPPSPSLTSYRKSLAAPKLILRHTLTPRPSGRKASLPRLRAAVRCAVAGKRVLLL